MPTTCRYSYSFSLIFKNINRFILSGKPNYQTIQFHNKKSSIQTKTWYYRTLVEIQTVHLF